jgi:hypothetical protein
MNCKSLVLHGAATLALFAAPAAQAQQTEIGQTEFTLRCAACHGPTAQGDGMVGKLLKVPPPDLTRIAERNGGTFPFKRIYDIIEGREALAAHGSREMPIWGDIYRADHMPFRQQEKPVPKDATEAQMDAPERAVEAHILALVYYIGTLQVQK